MCVEAGQERAPRRQNCLLVMWRNVCAAHGAGKIVANTFHSMGKALRGKISSCPNTTPCHSRINFHQPFRNIAETEILEFLNCRHQLVLPVDSALSRERRGKKVTLHNFRGIIKTFRQRKLSQREALKIFRLRLNALRCMEFKDCGIFACLCPGRRRDQNSSPPYHTRRKGPGASHCVFGHFLTACKCSSSKGACATLTRQRERGTQQRTRNFSCGERGRTSRSDVRFHQRFLPCLGPIHSTSACLMRTPILPASYRGTTSMQSRRYREGKRELWGGVELLEGESRNRNARHLVQRNS